MLQPQASPSGILLYPMLQVLALSATYTPELLADLEPLTKRPQRVMLCEETVSLKGVRQFYKLVGVGPAVTGAAATAAARAGGSAAEQAAVEAAGAVPGSYNDSQAGSTASAGFASGSGSTFRAKFSCLLSLLSSCEFHQAAVFCNNKPQVGPCSGFV